MWMLANHNGIYIIGEGDWPLANPCLPITNASYQFATKSDTQNVLTLKSVRKSVHRPIAMSDMFLAKATGRAIENSCYERKATQVRAPSERPVP